MRVIIGYGNQLRGEDGFGVDVIEVLQKRKLVDTKLISVMQLTPELALELLEATNIIFVDAAFSQTDHYALACRLFLTQTPQLSHHIHPLLLINMLEQLYDKHLKYTLYSMLTNNFDNIKEKSRYLACVNQVASELYHQPSD